MSVACKIALINGKKSGETCLRRDEASKRLAKSVKRIVSQWGQSLSGVILWFHIYNLWMKICWDKKIPMVFHSKSCEVICFVEPSDGTRRLKNMRDLKPWPFTFFRSTRVPAFRKVQPITMQCSQAKHCDWLTVQQTVKT